MEKLQKFNLYREVLSRGIIAVGLAHFCTHHLEFALPPLYPLMEEFFSYSDLGVVSSAVIITFIFSDSYRPPIRQKRKKVITRIFSRSMSRFHLCDWLSQILFICGIM
ncbi:MAG: hypothetical protein HXS48_20340 [Theionarchaea archaeon]|nr:MAG: hypothetical protein AYK19_04355 [Theionarchaea archaeon DG-70-1]MBU7029298.1 hypothetical protein [Theionarchaea archaeon]